MLLQEWQAARQHEISAQKAVKLEYDWTYTTPYAGTVAAKQKAEASMGPGDTGAHTGPDAGAHTGLFSHGAAAIAAATATAATAAATAVAAAAHSLGAGESAAASSSPPGDHDKGASAVATVQPASQQASHGGSTDASDGSSSSSSSSGPTQLPEWQDTTDQIDRSLLMERDPILLFDEVCMCDTLLVDMY